MMKSDEILRNENQDFIPSFYKEGKYIINNNVCKPLTYIKKKEGNKDVFSPFSFVSKQNLNE